MYIDTFGWTIYSLLTKNPYIAAANAPGLLLAGWYVLTTVRIADKATARRLEMTSILMAAVHVAAGLACAFLLPTQAAMVSLYGLVCNAILLCYYGAPLSSIGKVIKARDSESIYFPTVLINGLNACFWSAYAVAIRDKYVLIPNAIGASLALIQGILCGIFRKKSNNIAVDLLHEQIHGDSPSEKLGFAESRY